MIKGHRFTMHDSEGNFVKVVEVTCYKQKKKATELAEDYAKDNDYVCKYDSQISGC